MALRLFLLSMVVSFLSACVGPLVSQETARTVGANHSEVVGGYGVAGYVLKYTYGITDHFDIGVQLESLSSGLRLKYAFLDNQESGWSAALAAGIGQSYGGSHTYVDFMGSYLEGIFEPYGTFRMVHVNIDPANFRSNDSNETEFSIGPASYSYGEAIVGSRIWFTKHFLFSVEGAALASFTHGLTFSNGFLLDGALGYRW